MFRGSCRSDPGIALVIAIFPKPRLPRLRASHGDGVSGGRETSSQCATNGSSLLSPFPREACRYTGESGNLAVDGVLDMGKSGVQRFAGLMMDAGIAAKRDHGTAVVEIVLGPYMFKRGHCLR